MTLQMWATNFPERKPEHFVFPWEHYGFAGNERKAHAKTMDPNVPVGEIKTAWEAAKAKAGVEMERIKPGTTERDRRRPGRRPDTLPLTLDL